ncbi:MAG: hypothetical protein AAGD96_09390 [Chloroflexota bacterium]
MKPLVLWARWHDAKIRLHGRTPEKIWGEIDYPKEERQVPFHFDLKQAILSIESQSLKLDEAGIVISDPNQKNR